MVVPIYLASFSELLLRLEDSEVGVVGAAIEELARRGRRSRALEVRVTEMLNHSDARILRGAMEASAYLFCAGTIPRIIEVLGDEEHPDTIRDTAAYALGLLRDPRSRSVLEQVVRDTEGRGERQTFHLRAREAWAQLSEIKPSARR